MNIIFILLQQNGFEPLNDGMKKSDNVHDKGKRDENMINSTQLLFRRVPILRAMFFEVILSQFLSSVLNFHFMIKVKDTITNDEERAGWTGNVRLDYSCCCCSNPNFIFLTSFIVSATLGSMD